MKIPKIGLLICNSGSSNSGTLTGVAAMEVIKEFGGDLVGICSLPALANQIPRQLSITKNLKHLVVIDGCSNSCAKKVAEKLGLTYDSCLNLENDLMMQKAGPFTTLQYSDEDVNKVKGAIKERIGQLRKEG
jgi:uncharacterized metal-binding protein